VIAYCRDINPFGIGRKASPLINRRDPVPGDLVRNPRNSSGVIRHTRPRSSLTRRTLAGVIGGKKARDRVAINYFAFDANAGPTREDLGSPWISTNGPP